MKGGILVAAKRGSEAFLAEPGALIGQTALFSQSVRAGTATAGQNSSVFRISPTLMRRVLQEFPSSAKAVQVALSIELSMLCVGLEHVCQRLLSIELSTCLAANEALEAAL